MTAKTVKTVAFVANIEGDADKANLPAIIPAHENSEFMVSLLSASKDDRFNMLYKLTLGEVAAIGGRFMKVGESAYQVLAAKLTAKHGVGWADRKFGGKVLTELEKTERDAIKTDIEAIKTMYEVSGYSNKDQAIKYVKEWARGKIGQPRDANANKARSTLAWLKDELPKMYKRLHKAEDVSEADMALVEAMTQWFVANDIDPRSYLADK